jgi:hypothetical protein
MKQDWYPDQVTQNWTLSAEERELLDSKTSATRLSFALTAQSFPIRRERSTRSAIFANGYRP